MKKRKWSCKKFLKNILYLFLLLLYFTFIYEVFANIGKSPTLQYRQHLENGGSWEEWTSLGQ